MARGPRRGRQGHPRPVCAISDRRHAPAGGGRRAVRRLGDNRGRAVAGRGAVRRTAHHARLARPDGRRLTMPELFPFAEYWWLYAGFVAGVLVLLGLDLGVLHRDARPVGFREAAAWTAVWVSLALA